MTKEHKVTYWCGRPVEELSREELIEALNWCSAELERQRKDHERDVSVRDMLRDAKRQLIRRRG